MGILQTTKVVYVQNVKFNTSVEEIQDFFSDCGKITKVKRITGNFGKSKGSFYIAYETHEMAVAATKKDQTVFKDRYLYVDLNRSESMEERMVKKNRDLLFQPTPPPPETIRYYSYRKGTYVSKEEKEKEDEDAREITNNISTKYNDKEENNISNKDDKKESNSFCDKLNVSKKNKKSRHEKIRHSHRRHHKHREPRYNEDENLYSDVYYAYLPWAFAWKAKKKKMLLLYR